MIALRCAAAPPFVVALLTVAPVGMTRGAAPALAQALSSGASRVATPAEAPNLPGCTSSGRGFLRARLRGALDLDLSWRDADMHCAGGLRPDGRGLRVTLAGPLRSDGRRLRFVFGIDGVVEGRSAHSRPTNLTLLLEGEQRVFATRGDAWCTTEELIPARVGALGGPRRSWQISARGFCTGPATAIDGAGRIVLSRFDFLAEVTFEDDPAPTPRRAPVVPGENSPATSDDGSGPDAGAAGGGGTRAAAAARTVELSAGDTRDPRRWR
jgi:hypothetical protein